MDASENDVVMISDTTSDTDMTSATTETTATSSFVFHPGVRSPRTPSRTPPHRNRIRTHIQLASRGVTPFHLPWIQRIQNTPTPGMIRLLNPPSTANGAFLLETLWYQDMSLTEWIQKIDAAKKDMSDNPIAARFRPTDYVENLESIFYDNQRARWLARLTLQRWTQRVWRKRTQCNVDMIDMAAIPEKDAIFLTDTKHRQIFRFHKNDVFMNLLTNLSMADEMLPSPRYPTNPWTNSKMTVAQTITICQQLVRDYAARGLCPPVILAAFWAARFSLRKFVDQNSALLSQQAIRNYFKDLHTHNLEVVLDTITNLLYAANVDFSLTSVRRWLRQTPQTPAHKEWLLLARDYTLYINLHIQVRPRWYSEDFIHADVRALYDRTDIPDVTSPRMRMLRTMLSEGLDTIIPAEPMPYSLQGLTALLQPPPLIIDISGGAMTNAMAIQLIQNALFRM